MCIQTNFATLFSAVFDVSSAAVFDLQGLSRHGLYRLTGVSLCPQEEKEDLLTKAQASKEEAEEEEEEAERRRRLQEKIDEEKRERFSRLNSWKVLQLDGCLCNCQCSRCWRIRA